MAMASAPKRLIRREDGATSADPSYDNPLLPIYRQLSIKNGEVNRMNKEQLKEKLHKLGLDNR